MNNKAFVFLSMWLSLVLYGCVAVQIEVTATPTVNLPARTPDPIVSPIPSPTPTSLYSTFPVISTSNASELSEIIRLTKGTVIQSMWMPDGKRILLITKAGTYLYDVVTGAELRFFDAGAPVVSTLSSDGQLLATVANSVVTIWDVTTGQTLQKLAPGASKLEMLTFSPQGHLIAVENSIFGQNIEVGPQSRNVQLWDAKRGELLYTFQERSQPAFRPDNEVLAIAFDGKIEFWKLDDLKRVHFVSGSTHSSFGAQSRLIAVSSSQNPSDYTFSMDLLDSRDGSKRCTFDRVRYVPAVRFTPDETKLVAAGEPGIVRVWDTSTCQLLYTISGHQGYVDVTISPDGRILATYGLVDRTVKLWNANTGQLLRTFSGFYGDLGDISPDGKFLVEKQWFSGTIALWNTQTGENTYTFDKHTPGPGAVAFSPDGSILATGGCGSAIQLWSVQTMRPEKVLPGLSSIRDITFSSDSQIVAGAGILSQGSIEEAKMQWWDITSGTSLYEWQTASAGKTWMVSTDFSPDGKTFAAFSVWDDVLRLWDTDTKQIRYSFVLVDDQSERGIAFSPDSQMIAVTTSDGYVKFWDVYSGKQTNEFYFAGDMIQQLIFSSDGRTLFGAGYQSVWVWDRDKKELVTTIEHNRTSIRKIAVSPDDNIVAIARWTGMNNNDGIYLYDVSTQQILAEQTNFSEWIPDLNFSPDGRLLVTASADGTIRLWGIKP